jgi:hypothetical protein
MRTGGSELDQCGDLEGARRAVEKLRAERMERRCAVTLVCDGTDVETQRQRLVGDQRDIAASPLARRVVALFNPVRGAAKLGIVDRAKAPPAYRRVRACWL